MQGSRCWMSDDVHGTVSLSFPEVKSQSWSWSSGRQEPVRIVAPSAETSSASPQRWGP
jgi:hypothetical protein